MAKFPTYEEMAQEVAQRALDEYEYEGKTLREWIEIIKTQHGTNLAEVGTDVPDKNVGELISRQAAIDAIDDISREVDDGDGFQYEKWLKYFCELPPAQPEREWSELDKQLIDTLLRKIYELQGTSLSMEGVVAKKYYVNELYKVLFGRSEKPKWMI